MKKRNLIISLAALGVVASVTGSVALYISKPEDESINIGVNTNVDVNYLISDVTSDHVLLSPAAPVANYGFSIAGNVNAASVYKQPFILAKLTVTITPEVAALGSYLTPTCNINYTEGTYFANTTGFNTITFSEADVETGVITGSVSTYIKVGDDASVDGNAVDLNVTLDSVEADVFVETLASTGYDIDISLTSDEAFEVAYVVGDMNGWTASDEYQMVMNIEAKKLEWMWYGNITEGTQLKAMHENKTWSADPNDKAPANMTGAYWNGENSGHVTFSSSDQGQ